MSATPQTLINQMFAALEQPANSILAATPTGTTQDEDAITADAQHLLYATEGTNRIVRLCVPIYDIASVTPATAGQSIIGPYTTITSTAGRVLHSPRSLLAGSRVVSSANQGFLHMGNWYPTHPDGGPSGWVDNRTGIELAGYTTTPLFTIQGYFLPAPLTVDSEALDPFLDDQVQRAIAFYMAWMLAMKAGDNSIVASRVAPCFNEWAGAVKEIYARLIGTDATMGAFFQQSPLDSLVQVGKPITPRN